MRLESGRTFGQHFLRLIQESARHDHDGRRSVARLDVLRFGQFDQLKAEGMNGEAA